MAMVHLGIALALVVSATGPNSPELADMSRGALAPAPGKVLIPTKSFGSVQLDHPAHLARKISCKTCHGAGPVHKPEFTPKAAHETCVGCHRDGGRGPTKCRDCHIVPASPGDTHVAAGDAQAPEAGKEPAATGGTRLASAGDASAKALSAGSAPAAGAAAPGPLGAAPGSSTVSTGPGASVGGGARPVPGTLAAEDPGSSRGFRRAVAVGYSGYRSTGQDFTTGVAFFLTAHEDTFLLAQSFERTIGGIGGAGGRTLGLTGAGVSLPLRNRFNLLALGVAGFDATEKPTATVLPAAGARLGLEWLGRQSCFTLWATGITDVVRSTDSVTNETVGGTTFSLMMTVGFVLDPP